MAQYSSYYLYQKYEKRGEQDWIPCYPNTFSMSGDSEITMPLVQKSYCDIQCGCPDSTIERWVNLDPDVTWICEGTTKYYEQQKEISYDLGTTWIPVEEYKKGALIETESTDCGEARYQWNKVGGWICDDCERVKAKVGDSATSVTITYNNSRTLTRSEVTNAMSANTIEYIVVGDYTTAIDDGCFSGCSAMEFARLPNTLVSIGASAFINCEVMTECSLPSGIQTIGDSAFRNCLALAFINLPDGIQTIGASAFRDCLDFRYINIPLSLTEIPSYCFYNCDGLSDIQLHRGITSIGDYAFANCSGIYTMTLLGTTPPTLGSNALSGTSSNLKIYVPSSAVDTYKAASGWSSYANKIYAIE